MTVSREQTQAKLDKQSAGVLRHTPKQTYTVADRFEEHAGKDPLRPFLIYDDHIYTYDEVNRQANRYAAAAFAFGLHRGDVAAVMIENRPAFFYAWLGLAKIGVTTALINTMVRDDALRQALSTTHAKLLLLGSECSALAESIGDLHQELATLVIADGENKRMPAGSRAIDDLLEVAGDGNPPKALREGVVGETPLFFVFTSGTTGMPKAAIISHMRWLGVGEGWANLLGIDSDDVFYCFLPLFHGAAGMSLVSNAVAAGASIVLKRRFSASRFWKDVRRHGVTTTQYIGEVCRYLVNRPAKPDDRQHPLKKMTGAGLSAEVWRAFIDRFGDVEIVEGWGATEANCGLINVDQKIGSCGRIPFKDKSNARLVRYDVENDCHVRDEYGHCVECEPGEVGELLGMIIDSPDISVGRFEGYAGANAKKVLHDVFGEGGSWFRSGDLLIHDEDDYYYFVDRIGDTFRWKSENVSTTEVVDALSRYSPAESINVNGVRVPGAGGPSRHGGAPTQAKCRIRPR